MAGVILALRSVIFPVDGALRFLALAALVAAGGAVYFGVAQALGAIDLREVRGMLRRRRKATA
jgi:putative peptidoglycan lipid II flippase